jgi:Fe-S-cluster containining protein
MKSFSYAEEKKGLTVLTPEDGFRFHCHPGRDCFNRCCRNITIFLTPYDIIRMKSAAEMTSSEFLSHYTVTMIGDAGLPVVVLKMQEDEEKTCPFVCGDGCRIYPDRPWACRIYPLKPESTKITEKAGKSYYSVMEVPFCHGFDTDREIAVKEWIQEQGVGPYLEMEAPFKKILADNRLGQTKITNEKIQQMFYLACYDVDRFRRFVFESTFLDRFEIQEDEIEAIGDDDLALYQLALRWIEYGMLAQHVLKVKPEVLAAGKKELGIE